MKIYIIGPPGSGKTTLAKKLSEKYNIKYYELDLIVYDDENGHLRRSDKEILNEFNKILNEDSWIIEDVGRSKFIKGIELSDKIYYLKFSKIQIIKRIIKRWKNQRKGIENYNYPPTFANLFDLFKVANSYFRKESEKLSVLKKYSRKVICLDLEKLNRIHLSCK